MMCSAGSNSDSGKCGRGAAPALSTFAGGLCPNAILLPMVDICQCAHGWGLLLFDDLGRGRVCQVTKGKQPSAILTKESLDIQACCCGHALDGAAPCTQDDCSLCRALHQHIHLYEVFCSGPLHKLIDTHLHRHSTSRVN